MSLGLAASRGRPSDVELVRAARAGDATSLGLLLERYRASLYGVALQILGHGAAAEDAVHETFVVALRKLDDVRDPAAVGGWLHTVVRNVCLMELRRREREARAMELEPTHTGREAWASSIEEEIEALALRDWVWAALDRLSEPLRLAAMLRFFSRVRSYEDIAAVCGVPVGTVRSRLNEAKRRLGEAMLAAASIDADAHQLTQVRTREWLQATDEMKRHQRASWVRSVCRRDVAVVYRSHRLDGREVLIELLERDLALGVDLTLQRVVAGRGITIMEGQYANPPEDPFHCPPETTQIFLGSGGQVHTILVHFSARVADLD